jgi:L-lactate dehydrogenase (cytochrome)
VVTVDTPVLGLRERDVRNGATIPPRITLRNALDTLRRPRWLLTIARGPRVTFANVTAAGESGGGLQRFALSPFVNGLFDPSATWADLDWTRKLWKGPLLVKGVMHPADARLAVKHGADGIVVSNHGGRQLDTAPATLEVLPEIVHAVGGDAEIILDGGVRRGTDIAKALALGARACMIGRPYLYGLSVDRRQGVLKAIGILTSELKRAMALMGCTQVADLGRECVRTPAVGCLLAAGWVVAAFVWWGSWAVAISAAACWLVTTLFLLAAWELVLLLGLGPGIQVLHRETALAALRPWLIPAAVVVGLLFGHYLGD